MKVFQNKVPSNITRLKGDEVTGGLRKLHDEVLKWS